MGDDGHELLAHASGSAFCTDVGEWHGRAGGETAATGTVHGAVGGFAVAVGADFEADRLRGAVDDRLDPGAPALLLRQHERIDQRDVTVPRRVRRAHRACPQPGYDRCLAAAVLARQGGLRVQVADATLGLVAHPAAVVAHVGGEALRARPTSQLGCTLLVGVHRGMVGEPGGYFDQRLVDQHRHRIQVRRMRLQAQTLRLQRDRPPPRKRIQNRRWIPVAARQNLRTGLRQHRGVVAVLPDHQPFDDPEQPPAFAVLRLGGREPVGARRRIIHQRREQHRPSGRQRTPRPPQMQRRRMPVADRLLPHRRRIDRIQRQRHLDQLPPHPTHGSFPPIAYRAQIVPVDIQDQRDITWT